MANEDYQGITTDMLEKIDFTNRECLEKNKTQQWGIGKDRLSEKVGGFKVCVVYKDRHKISISICKNTDLHILNVSSVFHIFRSSFLCQL